MSAAIVTSPDTLSEYEQYCFYCLPRLLPSIQKKIAIRTRRVHISDLSWNIQSAKEKGYYPNLLHTSPRQISRDEKFWKSSGASTFYFLQFRTAPEGKKVVMVTRDNSYPIPAPILDASLPP